MVKIDAKSVADIEAGKRNITLKTIYRLVKSLKASSSDLLSKTRKKFLLMESYLRKKSLGKSEI